MTWKIAAVPSALIHITPVQRLSLYLAKEVLIVLMAIAAVLVLVSLFAIGLVLFSEGARFGFLWLKAKAARVVARNHPFSHREIVANPSPRRD